MDLQTYLVFIGASVVLCVVPGPDMIYLLSRSVASGRKSGMYAAFGINTGAYVHLLAAVLGLTAVLATSAIAFTVVKWLGAAYLVYLGFSILRSKNNSIELDASVEQKASNRAVFWQGFLSNVLNPKVAIFYISILPQFVNFHAGSTTSQLLVLGVTLNIIGIITNIIYVYFAAALTHKLRESAQISYWLNKALGGLFVALGVRLANEKLQ